MTEPINGVSLAENCIDIHSRGAGKKSESPYLSLKTDFTWVFKMEQLPIPRAIFSPRAPTARGSESPNTLLPNQDRNLSEGAFGPQYGGQPCPPWLSPPLSPEGLLCHGPHPLSLTLWESASCQIKRSQVLSFPDNPVLAQH